MKAERAGKEKAAYCVIGSYRLRAECVQSRRIVLSILKIEIQMQNEV